MKSVNGSPRRPRVLMVAYACSPEHGSEPGMGWNRALQAARYCDTWVICEKTKYGPLVQKYLDEKGAIPHLHFEMVPKGSLIRSLGRIPGLSYLGYNLWQKKVFRHAQRLHREIGFDLAHQVNFCGYREPGYLWKLGIPFIWGPVGGTQNYPRRFLSEATPGGAARELTRSMLNRIQLRWSPRVRRAARAAAVVLAANTTIQHDFANAHGFTPEVLLETGLTSVSPRPVQKPSSTLRILWSGDLSTWKALPLLLKAMARLPGDVDCNVRILGKGGLEKQWKRQAEQLGISHRLEWLGWLPHRQALRQLSSTDLLAFTSLRDTSGNVMLEALAAGVPVLCLDHQGARDIVTPDCGVKIPVTHPGEVITAMAKAIEDLYHNPARIQAMRSLAIERAKDFLWDRQGERIARIYQKVLRKHGSDAELLLDSPVTKERVMAS